MQLPQLRNTMQIQYITVPSKHQGLDYSVTPESVLEDANYSTQKNPTAQVIKKKPKKEKSSHLKLISQKWFSLPKQTYSTASFFRINRYISYPAYKPEMVIAVHLKYIQNHLTYTHRNIICTHIHNKCCNTEETYS